jgi:hypothetical protein
LSGRLTEGHPVLPLGMAFRSCLPFLGAFSVVSLSIVACTGGPDGRTSSSSSSGSGSASNDRNTVPTGGSSSTTEPTEPTGDENEPSTSSSGGSSGATTTRQTFPCGASKECEVGREACVYYDGSPFACQVITVSNQCNAKSCANAATTFAYVCDTTNYPYASCETTGGDPCKMTISCDP